MLLFTCILFVRYSTCYNEEIYHQIEQDEITNVIEKRSENGEEERNQTDPEDDLFEGIGKIERDIIISVLVSACIVPILCGAIMVFCQLCTQVKKKHLRKRMRIIKQHQIEHTTYNDSLNVIRMKGPIQLHESFPQYINGVPREEMECYMNRSAVEREIRGCGSTNVLRNNPETGQIEGNICSIPLTPPHTPIPKIAIQFPSPVIGAPADTKYTSRLEESNNYLYPPLPSNFKQGSPMFPKNSTPRSPTAGQQLSPGRRPSIRETPDRSTCHQRSLMLLRQITMSPPAPPNYYLLSKKNRELTGKSLPCLFNEQKNYTSTNLNLSMSGAVTMKDRSASESDISV